MGFLSDVVSPVRYFRPVGAKHLQSITAFVSHSNANRKAKIRVVVCLICVQQNQICETSKKDTKARNKLRKCSFAQYL